MTQKKIKLIASSGSVAAQNIHGDVTINNQYLIKSGLTEQEIKDKESQYLNWVIAENGNLEWLSLMELQEGQNGMRLDAVYTPLLTKTQRTEGFKDSEENFTMLLEGRSPSIRKGRLSAVELINQEKNLVLLGDPGSGKSAFVNFVSLCLAGQKLDKTVNLDTLTEQLPDQAGRPEIRRKVPNTSGTEMIDIHQKWSHGALTPLKIILRDFATSSNFPNNTEKPTAKHLLKFIKKKFKSNGFTGYYNILKKRLQNGDVLVMFDGLDEVAQAGDRRKRLVACIDEFTKCFSPCRFLVTCRPYAYRDSDWKLPRFVSDELAEFEKGQVILFIKRWHQQLPTMDRENTIARGQLLQNAVLDRPALWDLGKRPLLLSLIAYLHAYHHGLPDRRADLYKKLLDLLLDKWEKARYEVNDDDIGRARNLSQASLAEYLQMGQSAILNVLKRLAFIAHSSQGDKQDTADISADDLHSQLLKEADGKNREIRPLDLSTHLRDRVGILYQRSGVSETDAVYTFPHRSFQEYLSAAYLRLSENSMFQRFESTDFSLEKYTWQELAAKLGRTDPDRWREIVVLGGGIDSETDSDPIWTLLEELSSQKNEIPSKEDAWGLRLASEILAESTNLNDLNPRQESIFKRIQTALPSVLGSSHIPAKERVQIGYYLGRISDPRSEIMDIDAMRFCFVPKGEFWMGYNFGYGNKKEEARSDGFQGELYDSNYDYWIAQSPVSVAQFKVFVNDLDFQLDDPEALNGLDNSPVVSISQIEATKFCEWLTKRWHSKGLNKGWNVRLPNPEWEKSARGGIRVPSKPIVHPVFGLEDTEGTVLINNPQPQRNYPFLVGNNIDLENHRNKTSNVSTMGVYPLGECVYGCYDLSGNVSEWTRSQSTTYFVYPAIKTKELKLVEQKKASDAVFRGGNFDNSDDDVSCASRDWRGRMNQSYFCGFRIVLTPYANASWLRKKTKK